MPSDILMSFGSYSSPSSSPLFSFSLAAGATVICCLFAIWTLRFDRKRRNKYKKACGCDCSCDRPTAESGGVMAVEEARAVERQAGGSMMEQLVPEITTHALSYLDYTSLCRLSMTNSAMRRAANDDGAWKALYHKDFTTEQDSVTPINGWKSYYAATKAIINFNAEFYNIIRERSVPAMRRFWLDADYVKCIHGSGELFTGRMHIMISVGNLLTPTHTCFGCHCTYSKKSFYWGHLGHILMAVR